MNARRINPFVCACVTVWMLGGCGDDSGGDTAGTGGSTTAGSGGTGGMQGPVTPAGCDAADTSGTPEALHAAALSTLTTTCNQPRCHGSNPGAGFSLSNLGDLATLVHTSSCQAPSVALVDDSGGDTGLARSYLWQKLAGEADGRVLVPKDAWGEPAACGQKEGELFGEIMPSGVRAGMFILGPIRNWICAGAPLPQADTADAGMQDAAVPDAATP